MEIQIQDGHNGILPLQSELPDKLDFAQRRVVEPLAVRLAGEHDIWDHRDPNAELFQHGLRSQPISDEKWRWMLDGDTGPDQAIPHRYNTVVLGLLADGKFVRYAKKEEQATIAKSYAFTVEWEGLKWCAINHAMAGSALFDAAVKPEHDGLLRFAFDGKVWGVSLYHAPGKEHLDLALIASKHGGGGHKGAAGMRLKTLPFVK